MARRPPPIARIRVARSWPRVLAVPALLVLVALVAVPAALLLLAPPLSYVAAAIGALPGIVGLVMAVSLAMLRVDVEEAAVRVQWLTGGRTYALEPGPVTRVRLMGEGASSLRARSGILGWQVGRARLRGDEEVEVVRLARTRTAILVPTDRGRLAIAAASEPELLDALTRAARARKRLEDLVGGEADASGTAEREDGGDDEPPPIEIETPPHILTGIERAMLDEQLARQRFEAEAAARTEAEAAERAAAEAARREAEAAATREAEEAARATEAQAAVGPAAGKRIRHLPSVWFVLLPLLATLGLWGLALAMDRLPAPSTDTGKLTALAFVLAGPATSVGAIMARAWWPRLVGVVVTGGLAAAVFVARSLFGT
ncbi:MAG TPA: hypothetical protein VHR55_02475 [Candidatus Limnocylindria bacterium]|nr:hypothetical protein [Candidatus Limnocylindria bacterium]